MSEALAVVGAHARLGGRAVLSGASASVRPGEVVGLVGPNGAGKTTLLRAALGLIPLDAGEARLGDAPAARLDAAARAERAAYLAQERRVAWNLPAWRVTSLGAFHLPPAKARDAALDALTRLGVDDMADRGVLELSGGERARVLLARVLTAPAPLIVADEPIAGLDPDAQLLALETLRAEASAGRAVLTTLHDLSLAARFCDRVAVIDRGRTVAAGAPLQALTPAVLESVFGLAGGFQESPEGPLLAVRRLSR